MENVDMSECTWISKLFLNLDYHTQLKPLKDLEGYDYRNLPIELKICGETVRIDDFNENLSKWAKSIQNSAREGYINSESIERFDGDVLMAAEELVEDKLKGLQKLMDGLQDNLSELLEGGYYDETK